MATNNFATFFIIFVKKVAATFLMRYVTIKFGNQVNHSFFKHFPKLIDDLDGILNQSSMIPFFLEKPIYLTESDLKA
jgi:hypothetical protein